MAPKGNGGKVDREETLKAVVLADSFDQLFQPLSLNKPRCLLPLCNVPMLEYTLEFLSSSGVDEAYIVCQAFPDKLKAYIRQSKWARGYSPMKVVTKVVQGANSVGDALREIDGSSIIRSDFILCTGVVVSNMDLSGLVNAHLANQQKDRDQIMTMLLQEASPSHRLHDKSDESVYVMDPSSNKLLAIHSSPALPRQNFMRIQTEVITNHDEVELRMDLIDTRVAICSMEALALFTENFDYQTMRRDFVHGILTSDLLTSTIYAHILSGSSCVLSEATAANAGSGLAGAGGWSGAPGATASGAGDNDDKYEDGIMLLDHNGYAAGIADTAAYDAISRDLIGRWAYPLCPDSSPVDGPSYTYHRGAVYKASSVFLGRESRVEHHVVLGPNSHVADFATVSDSVLGVSCRIDEGAVVRGSYLFAGSTIGKNSVVERAMLGERVTVLDNVVIERGCIIGDDVTIGPNVRIKAFTRIARRKPTASESFDDSDFSDSEAEISSDEEDDEDLDDSNAHGSATGLAGGAEAAVDSPNSDAYDTHILGERGIGYVWEASADNDGRWDDEDDAEEDPRNAHLHWIGSRRTDTVLTASELRDAPPSEDEVSDTESDILELDNTDALASELAGVHLGQPSSSKSRAMAEDFRRELELTLDRSLSENHAVEVTALEMNTLRMAFDGNLDEMRRIVVEKVLCLADFSALASSLKKVLQKWGDLIKRNIYSNSDQVNVVDIVERHCALSEHVPDDKRAKLFALFVKFLYELDVIEDLTVLAWNHKAARAGPEAVSEELLQVIQPLVEWLEESEEESDEDDDEDEDESDEE